MKGGGWRHLLGVAIAYLGFFSSHSSRGTCGVVKEVIMEERKSKKYENENGTKEKQKVMEEGKHTLCKSRFL